MKLQSDRSFLLERAASKLETLQSLDVELSRLENEQRRMVGSPERFPPARQRFREFNAQIGTQRPSQAPQFRPLDRPSVP